MPFTFSHPALIIPIYHYGKRYLSLTGLVVGSIVPDFEYFLRMKKGWSVYSHGMPGVFWFDLPMGLLLCFLFHLVLRQPLLAHFHRIIRQRVPVVLVDWVDYFNKNKVEVLISLLLGVLSHLLWDSFTHLLLDPNGQDITYAPFFTDFKINLYWVFHVFNSLAGLFVLAQTIKSKPQRAAPPTLKKCPFFWWIISLLTGLIFWFRVMLSNPLSTDDLMVTFISAFIFSLLIGSIMFLALIRPIK